MKKQKTYLYIVFIFFILITACEKFSEQEKFQRPDWLPGKIYTTLSDEENLSMFAECLRLTGLDSIIDVSGSWSVFAPTNEAMQQFLQENNYSNISSIPPDELEKLTEFHVVQNPWSLEQLKTLSAYGWRTREDDNVYSYAYKRQTIYKNPIKKYWIKGNDQSEVIIMDSTQTNRYKKVFVQSRKNVPIFYDNYMAVNEITSEDFNFYFDRPYEIGNVYFASGKIIVSDIFAENGFVHKIDRVVNHMLNAQEIMERELPGETYKRFLEMVYWHYPTFEANMTATYNQAAVRQGANVDTLWDLNYYDLAFAPHQERVGYEGPDINESFVRHNGMFAPTDDAFGAFVDDILTVKSGFPHWRNYQSVPKDVVDIIVTPHFRSSPFYPSNRNYRRIFKGKGGFKQQEGDIIRREFGSNSTFIGINSYAPDKVFTSVTGPVFLRPQFSHFRRALLYSNIDDDIAYNNGELSFFPIPDYSVKGDSSLMLEWIDKDRNRYSFWEYNREKREPEALSRNTIKNRIFDHVGTSVPNGSANKEFIRNFNGNYIVLNNVDNTIQGNLPSTVGYKGDEIKICYATPLDEPASNGKTYSVNGWFNFESYGMRTILLRYPGFYALLKKAGFTHSSSFIYKNENYTVFIPSDEALNNYNAGSLSIAELRNFLKQHFLKGEMIFTDNKKPSGNYNTESGTTLKIETGPDIIEILDDEGNIKVSIPENKETTNIMVSQWSGVSSVVHVIDKVLLEP